MAEERNMVNLTLTVTREERKEMTLRMFFNKDTILGYVLIALPFLLHLIFTPAQAAKQQDISQQETRTIQNEQPTMGKHKIIEKAN